MIWSQVVPFDPVLDLVPLLLVRGRGIRDGVEQFGQMLVETVQQRLVIVGQLVQFDVQIVAGIPHLPVVGQLEWGQGQQGVGAGRVRLGGRVGSLHRWQILGWGGWSLSGAQEKTEG